MPTPTRNPLMDIEVNKTSDRIVMKIKGTAAIEDFFKKLSGGEVAQSEKWFNSGGRTASGAKFYKLTAELEAKLKSFMERHGAYSDFGDGFTRNAGINIAVLRAVGLATGLTLEFRNVSPNIEIEFWLKKFALVLRDFQREFIGEQNFKVHITYEV